MSDTSEAPRVIETQRLRLTVPGAADAREIFDRYASDPEVTKYLAWPRHRSLDDTHAFLAFSDAAWIAGPAGPYLIRRRGDGRLLGSTGVMCEPSGEATTGYVLARDAWGQGYATEALGAVVDLWAALRRDCLVAYCHSGHSASWRVLEKAGFTRDDKRKATAVVFPNLGTTEPQDVLRYVRVFDRPSLVSAD